MQKYGIRNFFLCLLAALFIGTGIWLLTLRIQKQNTYLDTAAQIEQAALHPDTSELENKEQEEAELQEQIAAMEEEALSLQEEMAAAEQNVVQLQQEYDQLAQSEESVYYQTIYESLMEGMSLVESYISGNE